MTEPAMACSPLTNPDAVAGNVALIMRGACTFSDKVEAATNAGATAVIIYDDGGTLPPDDPDGLIIPGGDCALDVCSVPAVFVSFNSEQALVALAATGAEAAFDPVRVTLVPKDLVATATSPLTVFPGGSVSFAIAITNNTDEAAAGDLFFTAEQGGVLIAQDVIRWGTVQAGQTVTLSYTQNVPANAPGGDYEYTILISEDPDEVDDAALFSLTVQGDMPPGGAATWSVVDVSPWEVVGASAEAGGRVAEAAVSAYPNPFAERTEIAFSLADASDVSLVVYDVRGRAVATLAEGARAAGTHRVAFDASGLPSGVYVYRLVAGARVETGRVTLVR